MTKRRDVGETIPRSCLVVKRRSDAGTIGRLDLLAPKREALAEAGDHRRAGHISSAGAEAETGAGDANTRYRCLAAPLRQGSSTATFEGGAKNPASVIQMRPWESISML